MILFANKKQRQRHREQMYEYQWKKGGEIHWETGIDIYIYLPGYTSGKRPACQCRRHKMWVQPLGGKDPLEQETNTRV